MKSQQPIAVRSLLSKGLALAFLASTNPAFGTVVVSIDAFSDPFVDGNDFSTFLGNQSFDSTTPKITNGQMNGGTTYSGPDLYGGVHRTAAQGFGGVDVAGSSGYRIRVNNTSGTAVAVDVLHMFQLPALGSTTWIFDAANDTLNIGNAFLSGADGRTASIGMRLVIREGSSYFASSPYTAVSPNASTTHSYSVEATEIAWFAYDPGTSVDAATIAGSPTALAFSDIEQVGFLLSTTSADTQSGYNFGVRVFNAQAIAVPEISSVSLLGLAGIGMLLRRRRP